MRRGGAGADRPWGGAWRLAVSRGGFEGLGGSPFRAGRVRGVRRLAGRRLTVRRLAVRRRGEECVAGESATATATVTVTVTVTARGAPRRPRRRRGSPGPDARRAP